MSPTSLCHTGGPMDCVGSVQPVHCDYLFAHEHLVTVEGDENDKGNTEGILDEGDSWHSLENAAQVFDRGNYFHYLLALALLQFL